MNVDLVESLGADQVIDYSKEDFTERGETYDVMLDAAGKSSFSGCKSSLAEDGIYLVTVPKPTALFQMQLRFLTGTRQVKTEGAPARVDNLITLKELIEAGKLETVIDRRYPLAQTADAFRYVEKGHKKGSVVLVVVPSEA